MAIGEFLCAVRGLQVVNHEDVMDSVGFSYWWSGGIAGSVESNQAHAGNGQ